ncbi:MAG: hypothetical protein PHY28_05555 [Dehalococcoidales bacterium]|nr:hypothetical protein [Dehalococcoidales bacterium]
MNKETAMNIGPWIRVRRPEESSDRIAKGFMPSTLIHDDDAAKKYGFQGGFVGGTTLDGVALESISASFGHLWYNGGVYSVRHKTPTYEGEVRAVWEETKPDPADMRKIAFHIETKDGKQAAPGWAAIAKPGTRPVPPWERNPVKHQTVGTDALPEIKIGLSREPFEAHLPLSEAITELDRDGNTNWWFRVASPWGSPIILPSIIRDMMYQGFILNQPNPIRSPRFRIPMDTGTDFVMYEPMFIDHKYIMKASIYDKWQTERTVFYTTEYRYEDAQKRLVALMHIYSAHIIKDLAPL